MKKIIFIIALLAALYTGFWFYRSHQIEQNILASIQKWKSDQHILAFDYDSISRQGYPCCFEFVFQNPKIVLSKNERIEHQGTVTLTQTLFKSHYTLRSEGQTNTSLMLGQSDSSLHANLGPTSITTQLPMFSEFSPEKIEKIDFKSKKVQLAFPDSTTFEKQTVDVDNLQATAKLDPSSNEMKQVSWAIAFSDFKMNTILNEKDDLAPLLNEWQAKAAELDSPQQASAFGTLSYDENGIEHIQGQFKHNLDNRLLEANSNGAFAYRNEKNELQFMLSFKGETELSPDYKVFLQEQITKILELVAKNTPNDYVNKVLSQPTLLNSLIPQFEDFGKNLTGFNVFAVIKNPEGDTPQLELSINQFDYLNDLFGWRCHGVVKANLDKELGIQGWPATTLTFTLVNYERMLKDLRNYFNRWIKIDENGEQIPESAETVVAGFLRRISDHPDLKDSSLSITFEMPSADKIRIGTLTLDQFIQEAEKTGAELQEDSNSTQSEAVPLDPLSGNN